MSTQHAKHRTMQQIKDLTRETLIDGSWYDTHILMVFDDSQFGFNEPGSYSG